MKIINEKKVGILVSLLVDPEDYGDAGFTPAEAKAFRSSIKSVYIGATGDDELDKVVPIPSGFKFARIANVESDVFLLFSKDKNLLNQVDNEY